MKTDLEIAQDAKLVPLMELAKGVGILAEEIELYGKYKAKVKLEILDRIADKPDGKLVLVSAITPTPLGEGKTVNAIGLALGLNKIGKRAFVCLRQPSMGPIFGVKGGAAGGGYSQVVPMEEFNLHMTGDIHSVSTAHNLLAAFLDNSIIKGNPFKIDPHTISWPRVCDISDRVLRKIVVGLGGKGNGNPREDRFDISATSEVMAILALSNDIFDLRERLGRIVVARDVDGKPVTAEDIKCAGAMTVVMRDAIKPNLMQTIENTPCFIHAGPFANIAHGNSSIIADRIALKLSDYVVTECGFGADMGAEKFFNIKCRTAGYEPSVAALVVTVRALKMHSGNYRIKSKRSVDPNIYKENISDVERGAGNLIKQIENIKIHGIPVVVVINKFPTDTKKEIEIVKRISNENGAASAVSEVFEKGGEGGIEFAKEIDRVAAEKSELKFLYPLDASLKEKIETIACKIYGASKFEYSKRAKRKMKEFEDLGFGKLAICMAKTHLSFTDNPDIKGRPENFTLPIEDVRISAGAGFIYPLCGNVRTMPGLPTRPGGENIDIDEDGNIVGMF